MENPASNERRPLVHPGRGDPIAYERYLASMDASMKQKVAATAAHLLCRGRVADMGMGSGAGSEALAALYPELEVVGVDLDPTMVALARDKYHHPNLSFVVGDIAAPVFADGSLDGIFDSSVLHHVTTFGGYRHENAAGALRTQARALAPHGVLVVRDFVDPTEGATRGRAVWLDLPSDDGDESDDPRTSSTARLFERFAREFRSLHTEPGFPLAREADPRAGWRRYRTTHKLAAEFILRKDYRADWEAEVKEEYTYFTAEEFESVFASLGLRLLASAPIWNPWIVNRRFVGKCALSDAATGAPMEHPPTNYLIAGERVPAGEGVRFRESVPSAPVGFLEMTHHRHTATGQIRDLVRKPHLLVDVVPTFSLHGERFVVARMSYPRPLLACAPAARDAIDGARPSPYVTEPLNVPVTTRPFAETVEDALAEIVGIPPSAVHALWAGPTSHPSPGGVQEEVRTVFVEIDPLLVEERVAHFSGFSTSGRVRALEARQVLRAAQVGGLPDARLETAVHALLAERGESPGPWIGEELVIDEGALDDVRVTTLAALENRPRRRAFAPTSTSADFLDLRGSLLEELDGEGKVVASRPLEYVLPRTLSASTVAVAILARRNGELYLGVDDDDLPAAQSFEGSSALLVAPAWRLPKSVRGKSAALAFVRERLRNEYGLDAIRIQSLGGSYHPSPGVTPEVVHPFAVSATTMGETTRALHWVPLARVRAELDAIRDGHLRVVALRAAHALGL